MFAVAYGSPFDGVSLVGPFLTHDAALSFAENSGDFEVVEISKPNGCDSDGSVYDLLENVADNLDDAASALCDMESHRDLSELLADQAVECRIRQVD